MVANSVSSSSSSIGWRSSGSSIDPARWSGGEGVGGPGGVTRPPERPRSWSFLRRRPGRARRPPAFGRPRLLGCWPAGRALPGWPAPLLGLAPADWPGLPPAACLRLTAFPGGGFLAPDAGFLAPAATEPCFAVLVPSPFLPIFSSRCFMASPCEAIMTSMKRLRFLGLAWACRTSSSGLGMVFLMISCWPIVHTFVVTQYTNRPAGKWNRKEHEHDRHRAHDPLLRAVALRRHHELREIICVTT